MVDGIAARCEHTGEGAVGEGEDAEGEAHERLFMRFVKTFTK
jgi:hypothetical protein